MPVAVRNGKLIDVDKQIIRYRRKLKKLRQQSKTSLDAPIADSSPEPKKGKGSAA